MKFLKHILAFTLVTLPILAYCDETYNSADNCYTSFKKGKKYGQILLPRSQSCITLKASQSYITNNTSIDVTREFYEVNANRPDNGNEDILGCELREYLYFFVKELPNGTEEGPFLYNQFHDEPEYFYHYANDTEQNYKNWKFASKKRTITFTGLDESYKYQNNNKIRLSDLKAAAINIRFQVVSWINVKRGTERNRDDKVLSVKGSSANVVYYGCVHGTIGANPAITPQIEESDNTTKYCIYPTPVGSVSDNVMQITNIQSSGNYNRDLYFSWNLYNKDNEKISEYNRLVSAKSNDTDLGKFVNFKYSDLGDYKVGDQYTLSRSISLTNQYLNELDCATPSLTFEIVPEAFLSEKGESSMKVCPKKGEQDFAGKNELTSKDWLNLKGEAIKFRDSDNRIVTINDAMYAAYGVKYGWEYSTDNANWITLADKNEPGEQVLPKGSYNYICNFLTNPSANEQDLLVPKNMFDEDKTYYFRQVVTLTNFSNRKIVSEKTYEIQTFRLIDDNNFTISPLGVLCANEENQEVNLNVTFTPAEGTTADKYGRVSNDALFQYNYSFFGNKEKYSGNNLNTTYNVSSDKEATYDANITVTDGCGTKVELKDSLIFEQQPKLDPSKVVCSNSTYEYNELQNRLEIVIPQGVIGYLNIDKTDENYSTSQYLYSSNGVEYSKISSHGLEILLTSESEKTYHIKKKSNRGNQCESNVLTVLVKKVGVLVGNSLDKDTVYVCKGRKNPLITGNSVDGGFGEGSTFSYSWIYSYDDKTYTPMLDIDSKALTGAKVEAGVWNQAIDKEVFIRRVVTNKKGTGILSDTSAAMVVMPYSDPVVALSAKNYVCYGDTVNLNGSVDANFMAQIEKTNISVKYWYAGGKNDSIHPSPTLAPYPITITKDTVVSMNVDYCGKTVSSKGLSITSGSNLETKMKHGACRVRGKKMEVSVIGVNADYTYKINGVEGYSAEINIPKSGGFNYEVTVSDSKCEKTFTNEVKDGELTDSLKHFELAVNGSKLTDGQKLCAGVKQTFANIDQEKIDHIANNYTWYVDGKSQSYSNSASFSYLLATPGKTYTILRKSEEIEDGNTCQSILDSIKVVTYDKINGAELAANKETVCYGDGLTLTISGAKGASEGVYKYTIYDGTDVLASNTVGFGESVKENVDKLGTAGIHNLYAVVSDTSTCNNNSTYSQNTSKIQVSQAETAEFDLTATPSVINDDAGLTDVLITATAVNGDKVTTDDFTYWYTKKGGTIKNEATGNFKVSVDSSDFNAYGILTFDVERTVYGTGCKATNRVTISQTAGFEDQPSILCKEAKDDDKAVICGGSEVALSIAVLPSYGTKVLTSEDVTYTWYRNGMLVSGNGATYMATAKAGDTSLYQCKISYVYDKAMKPAYVFSNEFKLIGKKGVVLGNVYQQSDRSRNVALCVGGNNEITLNVDAEYEAKDVISWEESTDGKTWNAVPETNIKEQAGNSLVLKGSYYTGNKGKYYFRVKGTSDCGTETYSKLFTLEVEGLPDAPIVALRSSNVINGTASSLNFSPKNNYAGYRYEWGSTEEDMPVFTTGGAQAVVTGDYKVGDNTVYVRKVATTGGHCASAVTAYDFKLYEELSIGKLDETDVTKVRCPNEDKLTLQISGVNGGNGEYAITWQYKSEEGDWISFNKESKLPFEFIIGNPVELLGGTTFQLGIEGLSSTTTFRAIVASTGDYKGAAKYSTEYKVEFYEPLKDEGIDISETQVCYGMTNDRIIGKTATGGQAPYLYQWYKTTDRESDKWEAIPSATLQNYMKRDTLYETTFYKRVVKDGCGTTFESVAKRVGINDIVEIKAEDIRYEAIVSDGNVATMWGMPNGETDASQYVWYNENWQCLDTTEVRELYVTKNALTVTSTHQHSQTFVFYAKKYIDGCLSYNSDTLNIIASKNTSGKIFINAENEDNYWVCPETSNIEILSESNPLNVKGYKWHYRITEYNADDEEIVTGVWKNVGGANESYATGENINLDTCGLDRNSLKNATGREKHIELKRTAIFEVAGKESVMESNVVRINIVPTMASNPLSRTSISGTISSSKVNYCKGDIAEPVYGDEMDPSSVVLEIWRNPNSYFGPGLYDPEYKGGVYTWFEYSVDGTNYDTVSMFNSVENNKFASSFYPGDGMEGVMNQTYHVRRGVSDGCTSVYSNELTLSVNDEVADLSSISMFALEPGKTDVWDRITKGFEIGDSLVVSDNTREVYDYTWSLDSLSGETFETTLKYIGFTINENVAVNLMDDPNVYLKRKSKNSLYTDCWSSSLQIPIAIGTASNGGLIEEAQKVCFGADFKGIDNIEEASGEWLSPKYAEMKWTYEWQWSQDSVKWVNIENSDSISLRADLVNKFVDPLKLMSGKTTYFRRVATNDSARVRYSNVATMSYHEEMKPGVLSDDKDGKTGYCTGDELPVISTTDPTGGTFEENGISYIWKLALDGGEYEALSTKKTTLDLAFVDTIMNLSRDKNVTVSVICEYSDGKLGCGSIESEPLSYVLYRRNDAPGIYQDNDSCDAQTVVVKVVPEKTDKKYIFGAFEETENGDSLTWENEVNEVTIKRVTTMTVDEYGVYSVDKETGCHSEYTMFNVDSLPDLRQEALEAPTAVCYGEDYTVKGGVVVGGNGSKTYTWQYSYDDVEWETLSNQSDEDLEVIKPKYGISYRRIVSDMCGVDTSNAVHIEVRDKIDVTKDVLVFNDFKCANRKFNIKTAEGVVFTDSDYYLVWNSATDETFDTKNMTLQTVNEFEGDSLEMRLTHAIVDTTGMICKSDEITVYAHHSIALDPDANHISCEHNTPCNGRYVEIEGDRQGGAHADKIGYKWYISHDNQTWMEEFKTGKDLSLIAEDTMYIRRIASNGCNTDTSNTVTILGTKVEQYDYIGKMALKVISDMQDSSVSMTIERGKEFATEYYFEGDGILPEVSSNTTVLPYQAETYKDSILMIVANADHCVSTYRFNPLRGGVIRFDGDSILCGGSDIPAIVSTIVEGGNRNYTYQWQYKNIYTADYVDIDGATYKEYTPKPVSVETSYRRLTMDGEYTSISNVIKVNIRPLPKTTDIVPSASDSVLNLYSLKSTQYSVEKLPSLELSLIDSISDADSVTWQKSYDNVKWEDVEMLEANDKGIYELVVTDTTEIVYYRAVATSTCGEHTSKAYKVTTLYASVILDEELILTDSVCVGAPFVRIRYKKDYSDVYEYSYKTIDFDGTAVYASKSIESDDVAKYYDNLTDSTKTSSGAIFCRPKHSFDVEITRWVKTTGASSTKLVHFFVNDLSAKFSYIVDGIESHESGEKKNTVQLNQGSRVVFSPEITGGLNEKTYKWNLIAPLNVGYYQRYGGNVGRDGLTSEKESPVCYFYNEGSYTITMQVSDGMCSSTISDTAMYISDATRVFLRSATFEDKIENDHAELQRIEFGYVEVYPTHFSDHFSIYTDCKEPQHYEVYDALGAKVIEGNYSGSVIVETDQLIPGTYVVKTVGKVIRTLKSK